MKKSKDYSDREWEEIAAALSGEKNEKSELFDGFLAEDETGSAEKWLSLAEEANRHDIDVDKAWKKVSMSLADELDSSPVKRPAGIRYIRPLYLRIAAAVLLLAAIGSLTLYLNRNIERTRQGYYATAEGEKKIDLLLPDGSKVSLNSNSSLRCSPGFGKQNREVELTGEAFFDISPDASLPFIISAGNASIRVVGTSFNVISSNSDSEVEVFVTSGKVMLSGNAGSGSIILEPGAVGKLGSGSPVRTVNENPNYLAWESGHLEYNGQKLEVVFSDLKRAYNMTIVADDPSIADFTWTTAPIDNQPEETIISLICISFNLGYTKDGNVYHLWKK